MNTELFTIAIGAITTVALGSIPWAYKINARLVSIETQLKVGLTAPKWVAAEIESHSKQIAVLTHEVERMEIDKLKHQMEMLLELVRKQQTAEEDDG